MKVFEVRISQKALNDMGALRIFLHNIMSEEGAVRYANAMRAEINSLSVYANFTARTSSKTIRQIHTDENQY